MNLIKAIVEAVKLGKDKVTRTCWSKNEYIGISEDSDIYDSNWCNDHHTLLARFMVFNNWEIYDEEKKEVKENESMKILEDIIDESMEEMLRRGFNEEKVNSFANEFKEYMRKKDE